MTTDNVRPSATPNAWQIGRLTVAGVIMRIGELFFCTAILVFGVYRMGFTALQTLGFVVIVFGNQATTYTCANRERRHLWSPRPSIWLLEVWIDPIARPDWTFNVQSRRRAQCPLHVDFVEELRCGLAAIGVMGGFRRGRAGPLHLRWRRSAPERG